MLMKMGVRRPLAQVGASTWCTEKAKGQLAGSRLPKVRPLQGIALGLVPDPRGLGASRARRLRQERPGRPSPHLPFLPSDLSGLPGREPPGGKARHRRAPEGPQPRVQSLRRTPSHQRRVTGVQLRWLRSGLTSPAPARRWPLRPASSLRRQPAAAVPRQWSGSSGVGGKAGTWAVPFAPPGPSALRIPKSRAPACLGSEEGNVPGD